MNDKCGWLKNNFFSALGFANKGKIMEIQRGKYGAFRFRASKAESEGEISGIKGYILFNYYSPTQGIL